MGLVHEQPVHAQLLKGHHIVLAAFRLQLFQPRLQRFFRAFQLLDREPLAAAGLHLRDALGDFPNLLMQQPLLAFLADGDFFKLRVAHNDGIIVAGGDAGTKLLAVVLFKVLFGCHQDIGGRVQTQELRSPLFGQVVWHHKEGFLAQPQALGLHCGPHHFKGLARAHLVGQQRVSAVQHMGDGIFLMLPQGDGRVHAAENNVAAVILAGAGGVHFLVVLAHQRLPPLRVPPNPVLERLPDGLLLLGGQGGLLGVQHPALLAVRIFNSIVDTHIPQVEGIFEDFIGVGAAGPIGRVGGHVVLPHDIFAGDLPLRRKGGVVDFNAALEVKRRVEGLVHELLDVLLVDPRCPQPHLDLGSVQIFGLGSGQCLHVDRKVRVLLRRPLGLTQLPAHVAGQVLVGGHIMGRSVRLSLARYTEDDTAQLVSQFLAGFAGELFHIGHVHAGFLRNGDRQGLGGGVYGGDGLMGLDRALGEHICFVLQLAVLVQHLQGTEQIVAGIIGKGQPVRPVIDKSVLGRKIVIAAVQFGHLRPDVGIRRGGVHLQVDELLHTVPQPHQPFDTGFGGGVQVRAHHAAVFPEVHRAVHHRIGVVLYVGVSREGFVDVLALAQLRQRGLLIGAANILHGIVQLVGQVQPLDGNHGVVLFAVLGAFGGRAAQHHLRVIQKILVDREAFLGPAGLGPVRGDVQRTVPLLQKQDVGHHIGPGVGAKGIVGQADRPQ